MLTSRSRALARKVEAAYRDASRRHHPERTDPSRTYRPGCPPGVRLKVHYEILEHGGAARIVSAELPPSYFARENPFSPLPNEGRGVKDLYARLH